MSLIHRARGLVAATVIVVSLAAPASASALYGAIAVNRHTGAWGVGYNAPAKWRAKVLALRHCRGECRVIVWVHDGCAAVVVGPLRYVSGLGTTKRRAIAAARRRAHHPHAPVLAWVCSG
jgi:hypothetical protein